MTLPKPKLLLPLVVLVAAVLFGAVLLATAPAVETRVTEPFERVVRVVRAQPRPIRLLVRSQGTVAPRTESELIPEVSGSVVWTSPALVSGGFFEAGDVLLRIDPEDYQTQIAKARAALARAEGELDHAEKNRKRIEGLAGRQIASPSQLDDAQRAARVGRATAEEARANLDQARRDLARTELRAPYSGRVREERVDVGQFLNRGAAIATIYSTDYVEIRLPIPDDQLAYLELPLWSPGREAEPEAGPEVLLRARFAGAEHTWKGRVVRTEGEIDRQSRMVHVVAQVEDPYGQTEVSGRPPLAVGLFVRAEIAGPLVEEVVVLPRAALRDGDRVLVLDAEGRLRQRQVEVLRTDREDVLIRGDLPAGTQVCVSPLQVFVEGMRVRALSVDEPPAGEGVPQRESVAAAAGAQP